MTDYVCDIYMRLYLVGLCLEKSFEYVKTDGRRRVSILTGKRNASS